MAHFRDILKNKNFVCLWTGQVISQFGDRLNQMALISLVYVRYGSSAFALAKLMLFVIVPVFIIGPVAGVYVDRWDKRRTMITADILRGILVLFIPISIIFLKNYLPVYLLVFLIFSITRFFIPSQISIIPDLVPQEKLLIANSLSATTRAVATVISLALAGILVRFVGPRTSFYIDAATYFISAALIATIVIKKPRLNLKQDLLSARGAIESAIRRSVWQELKDGVRYLFLNTKVRFVARTFFFLLAGIGAMSVVAIVFIQELFGTVTTHLGFLAIFVGLGMLFGSLAYGRFGHKISKKKAINTSFIISGIILILFVFLTKRFAFFWLTSLLATALGTSTSPIITSSNTLIHEAIPDEIRGRIFSSLEAVIHLAFLICMFISATLAEYIDKFWILTACGIIFILIGIIEMVVD